MITYKDKNDPDQEEQWINTDQYDWRQEDRRGGDEGAERQEEGKEESITHLIQSSASSSPPGLTRSRILTCDTLLWRRRQEQS